MRNTRKLILLALTATVAMAFAAASASAQSITVTREATGTPCGNIGTLGTDGTGGCLIHAKSEAGVIIRRHTFGVESTITTCEQEFHARISTTGSAYVYEQHLTGTDCSRQACAEATELKGTPWGNYHISAGAPPAPAPGLESNSTAEAGDTEESTIRICLEPNGGGANEECVVEKPFKSYFILLKHSIEWGHASEIPGTNPGLDGFQCEIVGHWNTEVGGAEDGLSEESVEVSHNT